MKRRAFLILGLALLVAAAGVVYAHWTDTLEVDAQVSTGSIDMLWIDAGTDDDGMSTNDPSGDDTGDGTLLDMHAGASSDDPANMHRSAGYPGGIQRWNKDVGICTAAASTDGKTLTVTIGNAYPSYHCSVFAAGQNGGTVPVKAGAMTIAIDKGGEPGVIQPYLDEYGGVVLGVYFGGELELTFDFADGITCGSQIDPGLTNAVIGWFHVEQLADPSATYTFHSTHEFVNWNEWSAAMCTVNGSPISP